MEGGVSDYNSYSYNIYCDLDALEQQLRQIYRKRAIPGQPVNRKGKPYRYFVYSSCRVEVDDMDHVEEVQKTLQDLGYQADSPMEWLKQSQNTSRMIQAVLGGIGAASLVFAVLIGMAAGFFPARRAMKLGALSAIRNE